MQLEGCSHERVQEYLQEQAQEKELISRLLTLKLLSSLINSLSLETQKISLPSWQLLVLNGLGIQQVGLSGTKCQDERPANLW